MRRLVVFSCSFLMIFNVAFAQKQSRTDILTLIEKVNVYWQNLKPDPGNAFWDNAAYHTGNMEAYSVTKNPAFLQYSENWAAKNLWMGARGTDKSSWKYSYGEKDFWSRGNGWLFAGLAKILPELPDSCEQKGLFIRHFTDMAKTLAAAQQPAGYWTRSLLDPEQSPGYETSGTAFFTYGYLWGINNGYLRKSDYLETAMKGWNYLNTIALQPSGKIGYVQPIGERAIPGQVVDVNSTANFGVGAFLLAASEMYRYLLQEEKNAAENSIRKKLKTSAYLFTYFTGNRKPEEQIRFGLSYDGLNFKTLNYNEPVISSPEISLSGGVRDPHILRCEDGKTFYMVATDMVSSQGWASNRGIVLLKSTNLTDWTSSAVNIPTAFPTEFGNVDRVWAPQTIYDPAVGKYMVYFSMRKGEKDYDKIYYAYANSDFTALETVPQQLFFHPDKKSCIDGDIIYKNGFYHLFFKTEAHGNGLKKAVSKELSKGWVMQDKYLQQTTNAVEGSGIFKRNNSDEYILMYDVYMNGRYDFTKGTDLENFQLIDKEKVSMDFHPRHGTVLPITAAEAKRLEKKW